jgi:hypothetical protein
LANHGSNVGSLPQADARWQSGTSEGALKLAAHRLRPRGCRAAPLSLNRNQPLRDKAVISWVDPSVAQL